MTSPTLTRVGRRVERTLSPAAAGCRLSPGVRTPRLRAIAWHRAQLLALSELEDDPAAQDAAGAYHMKQLALLLREESEVGSWTRDADERAEDEARQSKAEADEERYRREHQEYRARMQQERDATLPFGLDVAGIVPPDDEDDDDEGDDEEEEA